jgi:DNA-binding winged helix-turn-helix (wHTH) protein
VRFFFGDFALDTDRRELRRGAALIAMEPQVFDLLIYLVQNRERVVSKDDLIASVWQGRIVSESTLSSRITAVRKAVGDSGKEQNLIRTAARKGIRFVGTVTEAPDDSSGDNPVRAPARRRGASAAKGKAPPRSLRYSTIFHCAARAFSAASRMSPMSPAFSRRPIWSP